MNKIIQINDPILVEYNSSVDKESAKKMIAFKYFSNDICLLDKYLKDKDVIDNSSIAHIAFEPKYGSRATFTNTEQRCTNLNQINIYL